MKAFILEPPNAAEWVYTPSTAIAALAQPCIYQGSSSDMSHSAQLVTDISSTLRHYLHAWNAPSPDERANALSNALTPDIVYIDPHAGECHGIESVRNVIEQFRRKFDYPLEATGHLDVHHQLFRLPWRLGDLEQGVLSHGTLVGEFNAAGKVFRLWAFLDGKQAGD